MSSSQTTLKYSIYITKYIGVALIAGAVVYEGTMHTGISRYLILGLVGLILMCVGNILEAHKNKVDINMRYLFIITGLSFSTGFLSGGVQHYLDNPVYAGYLLSLGLFISYFTFHIKEKLRVTTQSAVAVTILEGSVFFFSTFVLPTVIPSLSTKDLSEYEH